MITTTYEINYCPVCNKVTKEGMDEDGNRYCARCHTARRKDG